VNRPRPAQLDLLLTISEGLSRGAYEMLRVSPTDALHPPSCGLAIRDAVEELKWMRAEIKRLHQAHQAACEGGDLLREEIERLRAALTDIANQETAGPYKWHLVVEHLCEIAQEALEGKP